MRKFLDYKKGILIYSKDVLWDLWNDEVEMLMMFEMIPNYQKNYRFKMNKKLSI